MARGLRETHDLDDDELVDYLLACRGSEPGWTRDELTELLASLTVGASSGSIRCRRTNSMTPSTG